MPNAAEFLPPEPARGAIRRIHLVAAARPNFMKVAPVYHALRRRPESYNPILVHTGQHYDANMSDAFFRDLALPAPDHFLGVGSGSHAAQTAAVMVAYEKLCEAERPDMTIVVGDVNSTLAAALVAAKLGIACAHLESGLRSRDRSMPEEINRLATDAIADLLWTPSVDADANLAAEGAPPERVACVGNVMIDSYEMMRPLIARDPGPAALGLAPGGYGVVTLHRPSNVDRRDALAELVAGLCRTAAHIDLVFPVHPRTRGRLAAFGLDRVIAAQPRIRAIEPLGYVAFMALVEKSCCVITDSGGVQEETTYLGIPCLTLRESTERPITVDQGSNRLVKPAALDAAIADVLAGRWPRGRRPLHWDGHAADRIVERMDHWFAGRDERIGLSLSLR
jgi:UDP-N-acetylglucosamine 2-epimerase (non-hydrolysing)